MSKPSLNPHILYYSQIMKFPLLCCLFLFLCTGNGDQFGTVNFETSCDNQFQEKFNIALSKLYSFWYDEALRDFDDIYRNDNNCCIALFMAASTLTRPIWYFISDSQLALAESYSINATACAQREKLIPTSPRERAYIAALAVYTNTSDPAVAEPASRLSYYAKALKEKVYDQYLNEDENAGIIYGLSLLAVGYYSEDEPMEGYPTLMSAGLVEEQMLLRLPNSPGAQHYVIHGNIYVLF